MLQKALLFVLLFTVGMPAWAADPEAIGQVKKVDGDVRLSRGVLERPLELGEWVRQSDTILTGADGSVGLTFIDNSRFSTGPNTTLVLQRFRFNPTTHDGEFVTRLRKGTLAVSSGQIAKRSSKQMRVFTPASVLGVRGTRFLVKVAQ